MPSRDPRNQNLAVQSPSTTKASKNEPPPPNQGPSNDTQSPSATKAATNTTLKRINDRSPAKDSEAPSPTKKQKPFQSGPSTPPKPAVGIPPGNSSSANRTINHPDPHFIPRTPNRLAHVKQLSSKVSTTNLTTSSNTSTPTPTNQSPSKAGTTIPTTSSSTAKQAFETFQVTRIRCHKATGQLSEWWGRSDEVEGPLFLAHAPGVHGTYNFQPYTDKRFVQGHDEWTLIPRQINRLKYDLQKTCVNILRTKSNVAGKEIWVQFVSKGVLDAFLVCYKEGWPHNEVFEE